VEPSEICQPGRLMIRRMAKRRGRREPFHKGEAATRHVWWRSGVRLLGSPLHEQEKTMRKILSSENLWTVSALHWRESTPKKAVDSSPANIGLELAAEPPSIPEPEFFSSMYS
jgi:hypothetical protein